MVVGRKEEMPKGRTVGIGIGSAISLVIVNVLGKVAKFNNFLE